MEIRAKGLCLRSIDYGDSDKLCAVYLLEYGKVFVKLRGVKKAKAKLAYAGAPLCLGEYIINEKSEHYTCINCSLITSFMPLWQDMDKFYPAMGALEILDKSTCEESLNDDLALIVIDFLGELVGSDKPILEYLRFLYKTAVMSGYGFSERRAEEQGITLERGVGGIIASVARGEDNSVTSKLSIIESASVMVTYLARIGEMKLTANNQCIEYLYNVESAILKGKKD